MLFFTFLFLVKDHYQLTALERSLLLSFISGSIWWFIPTETNHFILDTKALINYLQGLNICFISSPVLFYAAHDAICILYCHVICIWTTTSPPKASAPGIERRSDYLSHAHVVIRSQYANMWGMSGGFVSACARSEGSATVDWHILIFKSLLVRDDMLATCHSFRLLRSSLRSQDEVNRFKRPCNFWFY